jgi:citrate lyase subunit beta/citryl-CoA lyase
MTDRSYLFVPGDRPERFDKAIESGAHAVILDLEDAVSPERKRFARDAMASWLQLTPTRVFVRINPMGTPWHEEDCALLAAPGVRGVVVPKAEDAVALGSLSASLRSGQELIALVESVRGHFEAAAIAQVSGVTRLAFGSFDFMLDAGIGGDAEELDAVRSHLVLVSRSADLAAPVDGVSLALDNALQLEQDVRRSRRFGMGAKLCIHPRQVATVHTGFSPTAAEIEWADRVVQALANGRLGAVSVDGKLVDKPIAQRAQALMAERASRENTKPHSS